MSNWFVNHGGTICAALILAAIVALIIIKLIKDRKEGRSSCGCHCAHCAMAGHCHKSSNERTVQDFTEE